MVHLTLFRDGDVPEVMHTPDQILSGAPAIRYRVHDVGEDGRLLAGEWSAGVGAWRVNYTEWEFCHMIAGRARLIEDGAAPVEVEVGDAFTIRPGFVGVWEVTEPMRKHFVVLEQPKR